MVHPVIAYLAILIKALKYVKTGVFQQDVTKLTFNKTNSIRLNGKNDELAFKKGGCGLFFRISPFLAFKSMSKATQWVINERGNAKSF